MIVSASNWIAADRAVNSALQAEFDLLDAGVAYQVACAFLKIDQVPRAEQIATATAGNVADDSPLGLSYQGALSLISSMIAERRSDHAEATDRLRRAKYLAAHSARTATTDRPRSAPPT